MIAQACGSARRPVRDVHERPERIEGAVVHGLAPDLGPDRGRSLDRIPGLADQVDERLDGRIHSRRETGRVFIGPPSTETWTAFSPRHSKPVMIMPPITRPAYSAMISSFPIPFWRLTDLRAGEDGRELAADSGRIDRFRCDEDVVERLVRVEARRNGEVV